MSNIRILGQRALIGYTGFIGSNLNKEGRFTSWFNSKNIHEMSGHYDMIVCAAPSATKWWANQFPQLDWDSVMKLVEALKNVTTDKFILISTIDAGIPQDKLTYYGKHRRSLELFVTRHFPKRMIIRLPALFGPGLKKNILYDILTKQDIFYPREFTFQWFNINRLWDTIGCLPLCQRSELIRLYSHPISVGELVDALQRDVTIHELYSGDPYNEQSDYFYSKEDVLNDIVEFARNWRVTND